MKKGLVIFSVGLLFLLIGIFSGEVHTILTKATTICLECIGIG